MKTFRIYWKTGMSQTVSGETIFAAVAKTFRIKEDDRESIKNKLSQAKHWETLTGIDNAYTYQYGLVT